MRSDLSATFFLADPDSYDGGGLVVEGFSEAPGIKLPAGHMVLYPSTTVHRVEPVTRGNARRQLFVDPVDGARPEVSATCCSTSIWAVQGAAMALGQGDATGR